jgi:hypothetical protein
MWNVEKIIKKGDYNYCIVKNHPNANKHYYVLHHRVVVENNIGRILTNDEIVHHINGDKHDNRMENLQLMKAIEHNSIHGKQKGVDYAELMCPWCDKIFERPYRNIFIVKGSNYTCCSKTCRGKLSNFICKNGINDKISNSIKCNLIKRFRKYK